MKTVLLINSSGARYFRRDRGVWRLITQPGHKDRLWVIVNQPEETLETFKLPQLFGRDRSNFLQRRLAAAYPHSQYRAAPVISGHRFKPGTAVFTGLTTAEAVTDKLNKLDNPVVGVWGMSMLLTLMARHFSIANVLLALPSAHHLRILVVKDGMPVLTRCVRRYSEDSDNDSDSDANEILRTHQHLENRRIFEHGTAPPVLYLGDATSAGAQLASAGLELLPVPESLAPKGEAGYLHPLFEYVVLSPRGQLAPLQLRAGHLAENIRRAAYAGIAVSLLAAALLGQENFRALILLHGRDNGLRAELQLAASEREHIANRISGSGVDPALVRQATRFAALEMEAAPTPESILRLAAAAIADVPPVRINSLDYRLPSQGERYCQGHSIFGLPSPGGSLPHDSSTAGAQQRYVELQFTILLPGDLAPAARIEIRKRISATLQADGGVQLMQDPSAFSLINTLKGGFGMDTASSENFWCMSVPWKTTPPKELP